MNYDTVTFLFNKKFLIGIASSFVVIAIILTVFLFVPSELAINDIETIEYQTENNPIVAEVNGQTIRLDEVTNIINTGISQGQRLNSITALDRIIAKTLLLEEAQNRDIMIPMSDAVVAITTMYVQSGLSQEQFEERLEQIGTTYDQTLEAYREELIINEMLIDEISNIELQVSDKEAIIFFEENTDTIKAQIGNSTVFDDVSSQIKTTLLQQKQQQITLDFIENLKDKAIILTYQDRL